MFPELFKIDGIVISTYGVLVAIGMIATFYLALYFARKENIPEKQIENLFFFAVVFGLIGARIAYIIEHPDQFKTFIDYIAVWKGGIDWFGGFIGGVLAVLFLIKKYNLDILKVGDIAGGSIILGHAIGRLGCTAAGCCYGKPVPEHSFWEHFSIKFPEGSAAPPGLHLYPTQPLEAVGNFLIFLFLFFVYRKKSFDGQILALYLSLYGLERFLLEFMRGVTPPLPVIGITWNQVVSLGMVFAGVGIYVYGMKRKSVSVA